MGKAAAIAGTASIGFRSRRQPKPVASSSVAPHHRASGCKRTTILRQSARKLAESANASGRKIDAKIPSLYNEVDYFLLFARVFGFELRLLRM
jgi:hypothetical protein